MRINCKCGKLRLVLWVPNSLVKSKRVQKALHINKYSEFINTALVECKRYIKSHGHFTFLEVNTIDEGKDIIIKIKV